MNPLQIISGAELPLFKAYLEVTYPNIFAAICNLRPGACTAVFVMFVERILFCGTDLPKLKQIKGDVLNHFNLTEEEQEHARYFYTHSKVPDEMREFILKKDLTGLAKVRLEKN